MSRKADTWMPWYVADYLADTTHLSTERHGAYCLMLMAAWKRGGTLPKDDEQLAEVTKMSMARWRASKDVLLDLFKDMGTHYAHKRVTEEWQKAQANSEKKAQAGAKGGTKKQQNRAGEAGTGVADKVANDVAKGVADAKQTATPSPSPSPSPSPETGESRNTGGHSDADASGAGAPPADPPPAQPEPITDQDRVYAIGIALLSAEGVPVKNCRSFLALQCKQHGASAVVNALQRCAEVKPVQAIPWLQAVLKAPIAENRTPADRRGRQLHTAALMTGSTNSQPMEAIDAASRIVSP